MAEIYQEKPVQIVVNGRATITLMTHAEDSKHLVIGSLYTEKVVSSYDDIESILMEDTQASVVTKNPYAILLSRKTVLAGCGGASSFLDSGTLGRVVCSITPSKAVVETALQSVKTSPWFTACLFMEQGEKCFEAEDISSQNVIDQVIGYGLEQKINFAETFLVLNGNCVVETMRKIVIAKIPLVKITGAITEVAKETANAAGVTLL